MANKRKRVKDGHARYFSFEEILVDGRPFVAAIQNLKTMLDDLLVGASPDAILMVQQDYDEPDNYYIQSFRDETDAEMQKRLVREENKRFRDKKARADAKVKIKQEEMRELNRLLEKHGLKAVSRSQTTGASDACSSEETK